MLNVLLILPSMSYQSERVPLLTVRLCVPQVQETGCGAADADNSARQAGLGGWCRVGRTNDVGNVRRV